MQSIEIMKTLRTRISALTSTTLRNASSSVLLRAEHLTKQFGCQTVLDNISLQLKSGEVVLLEGANGSGKTTLLNILTGHLRPDSGTIKLCLAGQSKSFHFSRWGWLRRFLPERLARLGIGRTWQDLRLFKTQSLQDNIAVATPEQRGENPLWVLLRGGQVKRQETQIQQQAKDWLAEFGLADRAAATADQLSLGQAKRVAIARAVQSGAKVLFLDEPLAGLDASGVAEVMDLLERLVQQGMTIVIVEHPCNQEAIRRIATTIWQLQNGQLKVITPQLEDSTVLKEPHQASLMPSRLQRLQGGCTFAQIRPAYSASPLLEIRDLVVYQGQRLVIGHPQAEGHLQGLSLNLQEGEIGVLHAPNGWGKTTLLEAIAGLRPIAQGEILWRGQPIHHLPAWQRQQLGLTYLPARDNTFPSLTVHEALELAQVTSVPDTLRPFLKQRIACLSGGEQQQVAIACALFGQSFHCALLDEPFFALDQAAADQLRQMLTRSLGDRTLLLTTPQPSYISRVEQPIRSLSECLNASPFSGCLNAAI